MPDIQPSQEKLKLRGGKSVQCLEILDHEQHKTFFEHVFILILDASLFPSNLLICLFIA